LHNSAAPSESKVNALTTAKHEKNIGDVARQVAYIEDKLKKQDELVADVNGLKNDTAGLKNDCRVLRTDLDSVKGEKKP
jgi:hypothetical protein